MGGVLLALGLMAAVSGRAGSLAGLAFLGALTRYELMFLFALIGFWLGVRRQRRAMIGVVVGLVLAAGLWSLWSWSIIGDALAWWSRSRAATAWDARFWTEAGIRLADWRALAGAVLEVFSPFVVIGPLVLVIILRRRWRRRVPTEGWLLIALVGAHWLGLGLGFAAGHLPVADPRYLLVSLPLLVSAGAVAIWALSHHGLRLALIGVCLGLLLLSLALRLTSFRDMAYGIAPERAAGEYLERVAPDEGSLWVDAPVAIYYSRLPPERFRSSDQLLPDETRWSANTAEAAIAAIAAHDIRLVLWEDTSYSFVQHVWPQMAVGEPFGQGGYRFEPVYRYSGWELEYGARPTSLWWVQRANSEAPTTE